MTPARDAFVTTARDLIGLTEPSEALGALVDPGGTPAHQAQIERLSLCVLTWLGLTDRVLAVDPRPAYVPGSAPRLAEERAGGSPMAPAGALRRATLEAPPEVGDGVWYGPAPGHVEHVDACVVDLDVDDPAGGDGPHLLLSAVAGGQRDAAGHETIALVERTLRWQGGRWVCQATGRPIVGVLDVDLLAERHGLRDDARATLPTGAPVVDVEG